MIKINKEKIIKENYINANVIENEEDEKRE